MSLDSSSKLWLVYGIAYGIAMLGLAAMPWWTVDDAFISYRYGRNLLEHGQITWNPGEVVPVEGYTGILLPLLAAAILGLGIPLLPAIKILGILAAVCTLLQVKKALGRLGTSAMATGLAMVFIAATPLMYVHAISGLETIFFTLFITMAIQETIGLRKENETIAVSWQLALSMLLAGLTRPEGILLAALIAVYITYLAVKQGYRPLMLKQIAMGAGPVIALALYWAWRSWYYRSLLPNTYFAKRYDGLVDLNSLWAFGKFFGYYCFLPLVVALGLRLWAGKGNGLHRAPRMLALVFVSICWATYMHSSLWMNYSSRFFLPWLPILVIFTFAEIDACLRQRILLKSKTGARSVPMLLIYGVGVLQLGVFGFRYVQEGKFLRRYDAVVQDELIPAGEYVRARLPEDAVVISYMDAGALGYFGRRTVVDFGRLGDRHLARHQGSEADVIEYFYSQDADALLLTSESGDSLEYIPELMAIVGDPRFQNYRLERVWPNHVAYPYWQRLYLRKDGLPPPIGK